MNLHIKIPLGLIVFHQIQHKTVGSQQPLFIHICEPLKDGGIDKWDKN